MESSSLRPNTSYVVYGGDRGTPWVWRTDDDLETYGIYVRMLPLGSDGVGIMIRADRIRFEVGRVL